MSLVTHLEREFSKTCIFLLSMQLVYQNLFYYIPLIIMSSVNLATRFLNGNVSVEQGKVLLTLFPD